MTAGQLVVEGIRKAYGGVKAVDDVSFGVAPGEIVALIGPNGAGKSTCFNMLGGQITPDAGEVRFEGQLINGLGPERVWRLGIGRTFQIAATFASMNVRENVQMALLSHHQQLGAWWRSAPSYFREEAEHLLEHTGLRMQADRPCAVLSYGDLKRLELAMALGSSPKMLLMDEPTSGMAPAERFAMMKLVRSLVASEGISVLFTEHDMDVVFGHADRVIVLNRGRVIATGTPSDIRQQKQVQDVYLGGGTMFGAH
jgi:branched-chain amino acid transport system ATP-binding protein